MPDNLRSRRISAHNCAGRATTIGSYQRHADRKTDRPTQARRVLVETAALAERSAHGAREHPTADYARLSQRHPYWPFNREHGIERPRHAGRRLHYPREKTGALLKEI